MRTTIAAIIIFFLSNHYILGQSRWINMYFGNENTYGQDFKECYDNGYILTGKHGDGLVHFLWLIKTDINGEVLWEKTLGESESYLSFYYLDISQSGEIFLSGSSSFNDPSRDPFVMKLNACGEKEWCRDFSTPDHFDYAYTIVALEDGGCAVLLSYTGILSYQTDRICLAKIDTDGNLLWKKCYNSPDTNILNEDSRSLLLTPDNGFLISGNCDYLDSTTNLYWVKPYLIKTDSFGNLEWERVIHANDSNHIGGTANYSTISPSGQFYYTSISHYYYNPEIDKPALGKLDLNGNVIVTYDIIQGFPNGGMSSAQFINDSTLAADCGWGNGMEDFGHYLALLDTMGKIIDTILISQDIYSGVLHICHDNKLVDMYNIYQNNKFDVYLRKLNYNLEDDTLYTWPFTYDSLCPYQIVSDTIVQDDCELIVGIEEEETGRQGDQEMGIEVWPNPCREVLHGRFNLDDGRFNRDLAFYIYDIYGRTVSAQIISSPMEGGGREGGWQDWTLDVSTFPHGIYFVSVVQDGKHIAGSKFVVAH